MRERIVIADAHLGGCHHELERFLSFLSFLQDQHIHSLIILGDLFNIWIGTPKLFLPSHQPVIHALHALKEYHILTKYIEGNRDYFLSPFYVNAPFDTIAPESLQEYIGGQRFYFSHGDLVNINDAQYRLWRKFSRNQAIFSLFKTLPRSLAIRFAHYLEQKFRSTNQRNKAFFPEDACNLYAQELWHEGHDAIILGHFHEQRHIRYSFNGEEKHLSILPAWQDTQVYLQISEQGAISFHHFGKGE